MWCAKFVNELSSPTAKSMYAVVERPYEGSPEIRSPR